jgi:hypothetical protein
MPRAIRLNVKRILQALRPSTLEDRGAPDACDPGAAGKQAECSYPEAGDSRKRFRFDLSCDVVCEAEGRRIRGQLCDISTSGAMVGEAAPLPEGTRISLLIGLTDELLEFALPGEVSRPTDDGFAIRFTGLSREQYLALCDAISTASELIEKDEPGP